MVRQINELLKELGWADGFRIPVANKENKNLEDEIEELLREKTDLIINLDALHESVNAIQRQFNNYVEEEKENQNSLIARQSQLELEYTRFRSSECEFAKLKQEISNTEKQLKDTKYKQEVLQTEIDQMTGKLSKLRSGVEWGEEALLSWNEILAKGVDENTLIEKFCNEDRKQFEDLVIQRKRLKTDIIERQAIIDQINSDIQTYEFEMQQCGKIYRQAMHHYRDHIKTWNTSIGFIKERDKKIQTLCQEIYNLKKLAIHKYAELRDKIKFRDLQQKNNNELEETVVDLDRKVTLTKEALTKVTDENNFLVIQADLAQSSLSHLGARLSQQRSINSSSDSNLSKKLFQLERVKAMKDELTYQLEKLEGENYNHVDSNRQLNLIIMEVEKVLTRVQKDNEKLKSMYSKQTNELTELQSKANLKMTEVKHLKIASGALNKTIKELEHLIHHHQEILYNNKYALVNLMRKVDKLEGKAADMNVKEMFLLRIRELEKMLKEKTEAYSLISGQVKHSEEDLRSISIEVEKFTLELHHLMSGRQDRTMTVEGGVKELQKLREINQELQVEQNILQLQINQTEKHLADENDTVYNLEKQRLELDVAMQERRIEIQANKDILQAKKRTIQEEKSEMKRTIEHLNSKVSQVHKRFEIAVDMLPDRDQYDDEISSVTQCKLKIAQEKGELQEKGDNLDALIRKSEKEIIAMENTLRLLSITNDTYKVNLGSVDEDSPEMKEKRELDEKHITCINSIKKQKYIIKNLENDIKEIEQNLRETKIMEEKFQVEWKSKDKEAQDLDKELKEQKGKLNRAYKQLRLVYRQTRSHKDSPVPIEFAYKDIETRELQDINMNAIQQLAEIASHYVEASPTIVRYLKEKDLSFSVPSQRFLSITSSRTSRTSGSLMSLTTSQYSEGSSSSALSYAFTGDNNTSKPPSVINLDPFGVEPSHPAVTSSSGSLTKKGGKVSKGKK